MKNKTNKGIVDFLDKLPRIGSYLLIFGILNTFLIYGVLGINIVPFLSVSDLVFSVPNSFFQDTVFFIELLKYISVSILFVFLVNILLYSFVKMKLEAIAWSKAVVFICVVLMFVVIYLRIIHPNVVNIYKAGGNDFEAFYVILSQGLLHAIFPISTYIAHNLFYNAFEKEIVNSQNPSYSKLPVGEFLNNIDYSKLYNFIILIIVLSVMVSTFGKSYIIKKYKKNMYKFEIVTEDKNYNDSLNVYIGSLENYHVLADTNLLTIYHLPKDRVKYFKKQILSKDSFIR